MYIYTYIYIYSVYKGANVAIPYQEHRPSPPQLDAQGQISAVEQWRLPRTTTTLSWADGTIGSLYITVGAGSMTEGTVEDLNSKLSGSAFIHQNNRRSHMWDADTMLYYLEFLEVEVRKRRMELGLSVEGNKALIICDKASVHSCQKFELYKNNGRIGTIVYCYTAAQLTRSRFLEVLVLLVDQTNLGCIYIYNFFT